MVTLGWFFILGRAIVFAIELNPVLFDRYGSLTAVVFSLPVIRILPRHSARACVACSTSTTPGDGRRPGRTGDRAMRYWRRPGSRPAAGPVDQGSIDAQGDPRIDPLDGASR